mgnify:CR=1 FL=1
MNVFTGYKKDGIVHRIGTPEGVLFEYVPSKAAVANGSCSSSQPVRRSETPLQRYSRLCAEMKELSSDLALLGVAATPLSDAVIVHPPAVPAGQAAGAGGPTHSTTPSTPSQSSAEIVFVDSLRAEDASLPAVAHALETLQSQLLQWGGQAVGAAKNSTRNKKGRSGANSALQAARDAAALPEVPLPELPPQQSGDPPVPPSGFISHEEAAELEAHIARLEARLWGDDEDDSGVPLGKRIMDLQEHARVADPKVIESATQQAKIFAAQMQAMPQSAEGGEGGVSPAKLDEALDMIVKWDGVRAALPAVVTRMESLAELHAAAAHFHHRLSALERGGVGLRTALEQNALVMRSLKDSLLRAAQSATSTENAEQDATAAPSASPAPRERSGSASSAASESSGSSSGSSSDGAGSEDESDASGK